MDRFNGQAGSSHPEEDALARIAVSLADLYAVLYEERPLDARASLTGNMLAFTFQGGLGVSDEWLMRTDNQEQVREFREGFLDVVSDEFIRVVSTLSGRPVTYSFHGFDPQTRTTHVIFVLDLGGPTAEERQALIGWSEQVRRNARRLREEHHSTSEIHQALREEVRRRREDLQRETGAAGEGLGAAPARGASDDP